MKKTVLTFGLISGAVSSILMGQMIGDNRRRQSFVGDHAVLDGVAQVYECERQLRHLALI
ncbi:MAG: hypothetical protein M3410_07815 [Acidobacteriota bacterium]|nr:hypothetical protein [Acidobacteriota bacterium]